MTEIWGEGGVFYLPDGTDRDFSKRKTKPEPMGPTHPMWSYALTEVKQLLERSGRVYDEKTVEEIAMDQNAWDQLIADASANFALWDQANRIRLLVETLGRIRRDAESELRIEQLFGKGTSRSPNT